MVMKKAKTRKKKDPVRENGNKPKGIYWTGSMEKDMQRIRKIRSDIRISDSSLIADAMNHFAEYLEDGKN